MYGIVNKVISDYISKHYGVETWVAIQRDAGIEIDNFVLNQMYADETTFSLLKSSAKVLDISMRELKLILGRHWVLDTGLVNAPLYMCSSANNLKNFLQMLPHLHNRVMLVYPEAKAPEFECVETDDHSVILDYYSDRTGFNDYMEGLLVGLAEYYCETVEIRLLGSTLSNEPSARNHSRFEVRWLDEQQTY